MEFNLISNPRKFADIAAALGEKIEGLSERQAAGRAITAVRRLMKDVDLPTKLSEVGVNEEAIPQMAIEALDGIDRPPNPRRNSVKDLEALYRAAY
jgi:1,3-propanediol dehydrogenase